MKPYRHPPAWSPLTLGAILGGAAEAWLGGGARAREELARTLRTSHAPLEVFLTDSGTSALVLALQAAHAHSMAPVALPAYGCYDIATAADGAGVPFFLYDLDPRTLSPDLASLREGLRGGARTVLVAHLYGVPADLEAVQAVAGEFGALLIEDAAQGSGCSWKGRPAGAHGALGILSFGRGKGVTGGKGGALLVNDSALLGPAAAAWASRGGTGELRGSPADLALLVAQWLFGRPWLYWLPASLSFLGLGETHYRQPRPAGGISALAAGVVNHILPLVPREVEVRRIHALQILALEASLSHILPPATWDVGWLRLPIVLQHTASGRLMPYHAELGITRGYPKSLADLAEFGSRALNGSAAFPGSRRLAEQLVTMPTHRFVRIARTPVF